jgi:hypothetical protein
MPATVRPLTNQHPMIEQFAAWGTKTDARSSVGWSRCQAPRCWVISLLFFR